MQLKKLKFSTICQSQYKNLYDELYNLSHGRYRGLMKKVMDGLYRNKDKTSYVYFVIDKNNEVLSWALIYTPKNFLEVMLYTRKDSRKRGYCKKIVKRILKDVDDQIYFYPESLELFYRLSDKIKCAELSNNPFLLEPERKYQ